MDMPHIHELIDFVSVAYIVHNEHVLLVDHIANKMWLPVGGHIEPNEDPEQALLREIKEESGLDAEIVCEPVMKFPDPDTKPLPVPAFLDIHKINDAHQHVAFVYFAKAATDKVKLAPREHNEIRWFTKDELSDPKYAIRPYVRFYAEQALEKVK